MKRVVDIYVESVSGSGTYSKLELFNDEKIELTSSIQNIQDISKIYTDFTQSFTIPASPNNNAILHHFYQSDVDIPNNQWNFNYRIRAKIEIGLTPFKTGTIMVEKSNLKDGQPDSYTITFYGDLVSLKDKFGESKISDLDFSSYNFNYNGTNVVNKITSSVTDNVMFPLISSKRLWSKGDSTNTDITTSAGAINYTELFPAIKVSRIFDLIESKFGITFNSNFFTSTNNRWERLYLWLKNEEQYSIKTNSQTANITSPDGQLTVPGYSSSTTTFPATSGFLVDASGDFFMCKNVKAFYIPSLLVSVSNVSDASVVYYIDLYQNGKLIYTYENSGNFSPKSIKTFVPTDNGTVFQIKIRTVAPITIQLGVSIHYPNQNNFMQGIAFSPTTTTSYTDIKSKVPDMTISEFFSGILKMFNATCFSTDSNVYTIEPLDNWYSEGGIIDITTYVDTDSIDVERQNVYKKLSFKYEKSESFLNRQYYDNNAFGKEYSDTSLELSNEGSDFTVQLPFENLLTSPIDASYFDVGYCLTKFPDYKPYIPKPILLYHESLRTASCYINNGSSITNYSVINIFNNNLVSDGTTYSLTWHPETSTQTPNNPLEANLYATYYSGYLQNLFNPKSRLVRLKAHFPLSLIIKLRLNDRLVIRDKRYIINELKTDITTGEVDLSLINDFRTMINRPALSSNVSSSGGVVSETFFVPSTLVSSATLSSPNSGVTFSETTITSTSAVDITIPANANTPSIIVSESGTDNIITDDGYGIVNEEGFQDIITIDINYNYYDGSTQVDTLNIYQS